MPLPASPLTPRFFAHTPSRIEACVAGRRRRRSFTRRVTRAAGTARSASLATDRRRRCGAGVRRVRPHRRPGGTAVAPGRADRFHGRTGRAVCHAACSRAPRATSRVPSDRLAAEWVPPPPLQLFASGLDEPERSAETGELAIALRGGCRTNGPDPSGWVETIAGCRRTSWHVIAS